MKISVVTPNFNGAEWLERAIRSVVSQDYRNIEYIVMDGGSTDESLQIIERYRGDVAQCVSEKDGGQYRRNRERILHSDRRYPLLAQW